jgi:CHAT domain-containing protein/Tfp pilus assembly protein PilF
MACSLAALGLGCSASPPVLPSERLVLRGGTPPYLERPAPAGPVLLEKDARREEEIAAGETLVYSLPMTAGDYARVVADQAEGDVAVRLTDPSGLPVADADGPGGRKAAEQISWIAAAAGDYRLEIAGKEAGRTRVTLEDLRPSKSGDIERAEAEKLFWEADHRLSFEDVESKRMALGLLEKALASWQASGNPSMEVEALNRIGAVRRALGETQAAMSLYQRALEIALAAGDRAEEAHTRNNMAVAYGRMGEEQKALQFYEEALRLWKELGDQNEIGTTLYNLGVLQLQRGDLDAALASLNQALEIRRAAGGQDLALVLTGIARVQLEKGDSDNALSLLQEALPLSRRQGERHDEANVLQHTAMIYLRRGDLQKALEMFTEALDLSRMVGERAMEGQILSNLGAASLYLGDQEKALEYYSQALRIHQDMKNRTWEVYARWDIGWIYEARGEPQVALENFSDALEISKAIGNPATQALALHGMGRAKLALDQPRNAVNLLSDALVLYRETENSLGEINVLLELGRAWQALGNVNEAEARFQAALALSRQRQTLITEAVCQSAVARLERDRGNLPAAAHAIEEALRIIESVRPKVAGQRLRASFFASRRDYFDFYVDLQMQMEAADPGRGHLAAALAASERARARALLDLLAEGRIDVRQGIASELKQRQIEIAQRITWLQSQLIDDLSGRRQGASDSAQLEAELSRSEDERERLDWQIRREHPRYAAVSQPLPLQFDRIQQLLDDRTALLEYSVGKERSFLFVVTRNGLAGFPLPPGPELTREVEALRQTLAKPGRRLYGRYLETARRLYKILIGPAEPLLRDKPHLILAPDGPLLLLSFEALLTSDVPSGERRAYAGLPYLILERSVTYVPSASVLAEIGEPRTTATGTTARPGDAKLFLGFGAPDYGTPLPVAEDRPAESPAEEGSLTRALLDAGLPHPQPLPESGKEVAAIAQLYPADRVELYMGPRASEENVKDNPSLKNAWRIHFAVHGFTDEKQPELSGLVLSLDDDTKEDGLLQVYEIFNLQLDADLVVLSACDTGLGQNVSGEGLVGVTRALLYAGAASVVVSLWQVADRSTSMLMTRFYQHLGRNGDKAEALRRSKLEMIQDGSFEPYYWAPFILIGQSGSEPPVTSPAFARQ